MYMYIISLFSLSPSTVVLYAVSAVYFAGVMVRLMLTLTPIVCVLASISISHVLDGFMLNKDDGTYNLHV